MRNKLLFCVTFCAQLSLVGSALCAPPAAMQFLSAAGNDASQLLNLRQLSLPETGVAAYSAKILTLDGSTRIVTLLADGTLTSSDHLLTSEADAYAAKYGKLTPRLFAALSKASPSITLPVHIWAKVYINYPPKDVLLSSAAALTAHQANLKSALAAGIEPIVRWLHEHTTGPVNPNASNAADDPLIAVTLPATAISALGQLDDVAWVDLDVPGRPASNIWYSNTNVSAARGYTTASGVHACVVEGDRPANTTYLRVAGTASPSGYTTDHSQTVMGIISNTYSNLTSVTDASLYIGNWDQFVFNSTYPKIWSWCNAQGAVVDNFSWSMADEHDPSFTSLDYEIDWYIKNYPYPLIVTIAGNHQYYCENKTRNGLVVGGSYDHDTLSTDDDTMYPGSGWQNPNTAHNDYELPHLVAPAVHIDSADLSDTGTSFAAPQVSAAAMLLASRDSNFAGWPEEMRAVLMATALTNIDGSAFSNLPSADMKDGVGRIDDGYAMSLADPANSVSINNSARANGRSHVNLHLDSDFTNGWYNGVWNIQAAQSGRTRVIATWDATASCSSPDGGNCTESIDADLDLQVYNSSGDIVCSSTSYDSTWEGCDFAVTAGSTYVVKVYQVSRNVDFTYFALAWFGY